MNVYIESKMCNSIVYYSIEKIKWRCIFCCCQSKMPEEKHYLFFFSIVVIMSGICQTDNNKKYVLNKYFISVFLYLHRCYGFCISKKIIVAAFEPPEMSEFREKQKVFSSNYSSSRFKRRTYLCLNFPTTWQLSLVQFVFNFPMYFE